MNCPSCNQPAATFLQYSFSLQGVSFKESLQGYFKCQHCGTLLQAKSYNKSFWILFITTVVVLAAFTLTYKSLFSILGTGVTAAIWVFLILLIGFAFTYGMWKFADVQKVESQSTVNTSP